jgi:hypothetical protein
VHYDPTLCVIAANMDNEYCSLVCALKAGDDLPSDLSAGRLQ